jgi:hypothetical protein
MRINSRFSRGTWRKDREGAGAGLAGCVFFAVSARVGLGFLVVFMLACLACE